MEAVDSFHGNPVCPLSREGAIVGLPARPI